MPALLERDAQLEQLSGQFAGVLEGNGRLMVIEGTAGSGKSTLLRALAERAADRGLRVLDGRGGEYERSFAFGTVRQVFERAVADAAPDVRARLLAGAAAPAEAIVA